MALTTFVKSDLQGSITLGDGGTASITVDFDMGDLSFGPIKETLNETVKFERRGRFVNANLGARIYPTGSFSCMVAQFTDASAAVITDFLLKNGSFASNVSTLGSTHPVYAVDLTFAMDGTSYGDSADHTVTLHDCVCTIDTVAEGQPNTVSISFEVLGEITGDLAADEIA